MKKIAYLDCPTGIAGDMCLGTLVSAGVPLDYLVEHLNGLGIAQEYGLRAQLVRRNGQEATKVYVDLRHGVEIPPDADEPAEAPTFVHDHHHEHHGGGVLNRQETEAKIKQEEHSHGHGEGHTRLLPEIEGMIRSARLPKQAEVWSLAVFRKLAEAEGAVHGIAPEAVHFHEVGAADAIVDIVGTCLGLDWLGIDVLYCSPLPTGGGTVWAAHGRMPVPTPAVLKLFEMGRVPVYSNGIDRELVTPTGAAIVCTLAAGFGRAPAFSVEKVGLGAGSRNLPIPNILRLWLGRGDFKAEEELSIAQSPALIPYQVEIVSVLETQIDDLSPQAIGYVFDALFEVGALDVFTQPVAMKKSRTGILLTVICYPEKQGACEAVIFRETTTLGIRRRFQERSLLPREIVPVQTAFGVVRVKLAKAGGEVINVQPEYDDCAKIARQENLPWREVHRMALESWHKEFPK